MSNLNENVYNNQEGKCADSNLLGSGRDGSTSSAVSVSRSMESENEKTCACPNSNNLEELRTTQIDSLIKIKDTVIGLISRMEEADFSKVEKRIQHSSSMSVVRDLTSCPSVAEHSDPNNFNCPESTESNDIIPAKVLVNANVKNDTLGSRGILFDSSGEEFIQKKNATLKNIKQLNFSARFMEENMEIVLINERSLLVIDNDFVAEVKIEDPDLLDETCNFDDAKKVLLSKLRIVEVFSDKQTAESEKCRKLLQTLGLERPISKISWKKETLESQCLEREFWFLLRLLSHFSFGVDLQKISFECKLQILIEPDTHKETPKSSVANSSRISDELYIWYWLIDDTLAHVFSESFPVQLKECILEWYLDLIQAAHQDKLDAIHVAAHNVIPFIVKVAPYVFSTSSDDSTDRKIFLKQMAIISSRKHSNRSHDLTQEFYQFWQIKKAIIDQLPLKMSISKMKLLQTLLIDIVLFAMEKRVKTESLLAFFRTYESFINDLNQVPFDWYIKSIGDSDMQTFINLEKIELVDNELANTKYKTYRVVDPNKFPFLCKALIDDVQIPKHYGIEILKQAVSNVISQLQRRTWPTNEKLSENDQLSTARELLRVMHRFLPFLRNQAEYVSFEVFNKETLEPIHFVIKSSTTLQDFKERCHQIRKALEFKHKQYEISEDMLLQQYEKLNPTHDVQLLGQLYLKYCSHYEAFIWSSYEKSYSARVAAVVRNVKTLIPDSHLIHFSNWDTNFKQQQVPQIIAGLAAVWTLVESSAFQTTGCFVSPHFGQILSIFRLLGVDKSTSGIDAQLAHISPREGKSLVLALLAAFFALMGHNVHIVCYNSYLAQRDQQKFSAFYKVLEVGSKVSVKCVEDELCYIRESMNYLVQAADSDKIAPAGFKSVAVLDDVEFLNEFIHEKLDMKLIIEGLDQIQVFIWKTVSKGCYDSKVVVKHVYEFTQSPQFSCAKGFQIFLNNKRKFKICNSVVSFDNNRLFHEHLRLMIDCAINVAQNPSASWSNCYLDYYKMFNYFRLIKGNFVPQIDVHYNYGYLDIRHALFTEFYSLVLGVSGMPLDQLNTNIENILFDLKECFRIPTQFARSNLLYSKDCTLRHSIWLETIFNNSNNVIAKNRAVIIFFKNEHNLCRFKASYGSKIERLNVLTEDTKKKQNIINEAGIAKTVTLTTVGLSVGVNFRSSQEVEQNGGMHVIQTFSEQRFAHYHLEYRAAKAGGKGSFEILDHEETSTAVHKVHHAKPRRLGLCSLD